MGSRIHPQPGEPFCEYCHTDDGEECTPEHRAYVEPTPFRGTLSYQEEHELRAQLAEAQREVERRIAESDAHGEVCVELDTWKTERIKTLEAEVERLRGAYAVECDESVKVHARLNERLERIATLESALREAKMFLSCECAVGLCTSKAEKTIDTALGSSATSEPDKKGCERCNGGMEYHTCGRDPHDPYPERWPPRGTGEEGRE